MNIMLGLGRLDWSSWLYGALSAVISGGAIGSGIIMGLRFADPVHAAGHPGEVLTMAGGAFLACGLVAFFNFIREKPLPTVTTTLQSKTTTTSLTTVVQLPASEPDKK